MQMAQPPVAQQAQYTQQQQQQQQCIAVDPRTLHQFQLRALLDQLQARRFGVATPGDAEAAAAAAGLPLPLLVISPSFLWDPSPPLPLPLPLAQAVAPEPPVVQALGLAGPQAQQPQVPLGLGLGLALPLPLPPPRLHMFKLVQEPNETQRKSYRNENRYILPNPLIITWSGSPHAEVTGMVYVSLAMENGEDATQEWQEMLDGAHKNKPLEDKRANFALKMLSTSGETKFCLLFRVRYKVAKCDEDCIDTIWSRPFRVESNRKKNCIERPRLWRVKPTFGFSDEEVDVWIWGVKFCDRANMHVSFGAYDAPITKIEGNVLQCNAPKRLDLTRDTQVTVLIANIHPQHGMLHAVETQTYTYKIRR
eukprot:TRINITY_DN2693_c0_g1_i1.p1 TRINITY_DN2693_c0_g1~~TRINITY_DN2693_c0_g1_i1.p1  ORF type:complete len:365 (+),score=138.68 TRINITY_DN2693_c0_g1_i1:150-1244(+)